MPSWGLIVKKTWFSGPRISSTFPMGVCRSVSYHLCLKAHFKEWRCGYLVLEVNGRIEVGYLGVYRFAEHFVFDIVHELAHFYGM
jgi:hypothetical protein